MIRHMILCTYMPSFVGWVVEFQFTEFRQRIRTTTLTTVVLNQHLFSSPGLGEFGAASFGEFDSREPLSIC